MNSQSTFSRAFAILMSLVLIFSVVAVKFDPSLNNAFTCYYNSFFTYSVVDNFEGDGNPFTVGQRIYPVDDFCTADPMSDDAKNTMDGVTVLDISSEHVRVQFDNGEVHLYNMAWFKQPVVASDRYYGDWLVGNPFSVDQTVCAVPDSIREPFPDSGVIADIDDNFVYLVGYENPIGYGHFQDCVK